MLHFKSCDLIVSIFFFYRETPYDKSLIQRYRKALDTAVKIATVYNVQPIKGKTIVLCDIGLNMDVNCTSARGLGKAIKVLKKNPKFCICFTKYLATPPLGNMSHLTGEKIHKYW